MLSDEWGIGGVGELINYDVWLLADGRKRVEVTASLPLSRCRDRIDIFEESNLFISLKGQEAHAKPFFR